MKRTRHLLPHTPGRLPQHTGPAADTARKRRAWARRGGLLLLMPGLLSAAEAEAAGNTSSEITVSLPAVEVSDETYRQTAT
jgi:hypothetical protein